MIILKRCFSIIILISIVLVLFQAVSAEMITLKSGKKVEGRIVERNGEYLTVESGGYALCYENKYVQSIEDTPVGAAVEGAGPGDADMLFRKGLEYASVGSFTEAKIALQKAAELAPGNDNMVQAYAILQELENGELSREYALILFHGFNALYEEAYSTAVICLHKALEFKPADADILYNLGSAYYSLAQYPLAIQYLTQALEKNTEDAQGYQLLGQAYYFDRQYKPAAEALMISSELFRAEELSGSNDQS